MQEVAIRLRFLKECLGSAKRQRNDKQVIFAFPRDGEGRVAFLPGRWHQLLAYAAKVLNSHVDQVAKIDWDPAIDGSLRGDWRRYVVSKAEDPRGRARYALHEAFPPGSIVGLNAVLPDGLSIEQFTRLLAVAGKYKGCSPFQDGSVPYGRFEVESVKPVARPVSKE